jgi:hypothetical protein
MSIKKWRYKTMDAIKNIMDILTACGCDPVAKNQNGETVIKINAPAIKKEYISVNSWAQSMSLSDCLNRAKIPFRTCVINTGSAAHYIAAGDLERARAAVPYCKWEEVQKR